jgi:hypothetical protein
MRTGKKPAITAAASERRITRWRRRWLVSARQRGT